MHAETPVVIGFKNNIIDVEDNIIQLSRIKMMCLSVCPYQKLGCTKSQMQNCTHRTSLYFGTEGVSQYYSQIIRTASKGSTPSPRPGATYLPHHMVRPDHARTTRAAQPPPACHQVSIYPAPARLWRVNSQRREVSRNVNQLLST